MSSIHLFSVLLIFYSCQLRQSYGEDKLISRALAAIAEKHPETLDRGLIEEASMTGPELIRKYGYPVEKHTVVTPDGFILEMHRIPKKGGLPVLLVHGLLFSSDGWVIFGPQKSLAYQLADTGYDVWLANVRGTRYSRRHKKMSPKDLKFWDFSFHEIGIYDLPSFIDHITSITGYPRIHYVGYSQGTTAFWIMCSEVPGYCDKIIVMNALAPVAFMENCKSPLVRALTPFINELEVLTKLIGIGELLPHNQLLSMGGQLACRDQAITQALCWNSAFFLVGYNTELLNTTNLPILFSHVPAGASAKQLIHYGQLTQTKYFRKYNYGTFQNIIRYGKIDPPRYDLAKVTAPVALHYGRNDWLTVPKDVQRLAAVLPNMIENRMVPHMKFTHGDFMYANGVSTLLYNRVISIMQDAEQKLEQSRTE